MRLPRTIDSAPATAPRSTPRSWREQFVSLVVRPPSSSPPGLRASHDAARPYGLATGRVRSLAAAVGKNVRGAALAFALALMLQTATPLWAEPAPPPATPSPAATTTPAPSPEPSPTTTAAPSPTPSTAPAPPPRKGDSAASVRLQLTQGYDELGLTGWSVFLGANAGKKSDDLIRQAAGALDDSTGQMARVYGQIYGDRAGSDFAAIWKKQNAALVDYARALSKKDEAARNAARKIMVDAFPAQMSAFVSGLSRLPREAVTALLSEYAQNMLVAAEAQMVRDYNNEYRALDAACAALDKMADDQAEAVVRAFPARYPGSPALPSVTLRVRMCELLGQQMFTLAMANRANVASNIDEYYALFARSDLISTRLGRELTPFGGSEFTGQFIALWKKYIASLQDYEKAREAKDNNMRKRVQGDLANHATELVALLIPPPPVRAVPPPRKGGSKPKTPPQPPLFKDVQAFFTANLSIIDDVTRGRDPFGAARHAFNETRDFTEAVCAQIFARFGESPKDAGNPNS